MSNTNWAALRQPYFNPKGQSYISFFSFLFCSLYPGQAPFYGYDSLWNSHSYCNLKKTHKSLSSVPTIAEVQTRIITAGTCYSTLLNWLDSVTAASALPSASYVKRAVFFVYFYLRHFWVQGVVQDRGEKNWSQLFFFPVFFLFGICFSTNMYQNKKCPPSWKWSSEWLRKGPQHRGGHSVVLVFTESTGNHEAQMVFYACKCFVFWSRRKDTWTESQA